MEADKKFWIPRAFFMLLTHLKLNYFIYEIMIHLHVILNNYPLFTITVVHV